MKKQIADVFPRILLLSTILVVVSFTGRNLSSLKYLRVIYSSSSGLRIFDLPASHPRAALWTANMYYQIGEDQKAIDILERVTSLSDDLNALYFLGVIQKSNGRVFEALNTWAKALDGRILVQFGNQARGVAKQEIAYRLAYNIDPELYSLNYLRFLYRQENNEQFESVILKVIKDYPHSAFQEQWNLLLARYYFFHGNQETAITMYLNLIDMAKSRQKKHEILAELGKIYKMDSRWQEAREIYAQLLKEEPNTPLYSYALGVILFEQGNKFGEADRYFEKFISLSDNKGKAYYMIGKFYYSKYEYGLALANVDKAFKYNSSPLFKWYILLSNIHRDMGDIEKAIKVLIEAKQKNTNLMFVEYKLGLLYLDSERYEDARTSAETILKIMVIPDEKSLKTRQ
ncbi:MAG: DUF3808 domain-containing protein [Anaerolineae bacterium]|nr:DUF3808 domain-containing protein [Anaerolineae bacterium]